MLHWRAVLYAREQLQRRIHRRRKSQQGSFRCATVALVTSPDGMEMPGNAIAVIFHGQDSKRRRADWRLRRRRPAR